MARDRQAGRAPGSADCAMGYRLRGDVHYCAVGERTVFLDVENDRYFCLPSDTELAFQALRHGEPIGDAIRAALAPLLDAGILIDDGSPIHQLPESDPLAQAREAEPTIGPPPRVVDVALAIACQIWASQRLRRKSFAEIIASLRAARLRLVGTSAIDIDQRLAELSSAFARTAMLSRTADRCLPRALAFASACHVKRIAPTIVFGVQLNPFRAHCWVQHDVRIIFDDLGQAPLFSPIMAV